MLESKASKTIFTIVLIASVIGFAWSYYNYQQTKQELVKVSTIAANKQISDEEIKALLDKVRMHMVLPEEGDPLIATILDVEALVKEQKFYEGAKNGDRVIVYPDRAIIFSEERDRIVNVGPVVQNLAPATEKVSQIKLDIRNGSTVGGAATSLSTQLESNGQYKVLKTADAANRDYKGYTIVNLSGVDVSGLAKDLKTNTIVTKLPEGEAATSADVLVIIGN